MGTNCNINPNNLNLENCQKMFEFLRDFKIRTMDFQGVGDASPFFMGSYILGDVNQKTLETCPRDAYSHCGTSCCVAGWAPYVLNIPFVRNEYFSNYIDHHLNLKGVRWSWVCDGSWEDVPETAAFRLQYVMRFRLKNKTITGRIQQANDDGLNGYAMLKHYEEMDKSYLPTEWLSRAAASRKDY